MEKITRIDYIVDPLFAIDISRKKTGRLVDNLIELSEKYGRNPKNLAILSPDPLSEHDTCGAFESEINGFVLEYLAQQTRLIQSFIKNYRNFYIGNTKNYSNYEPSIEMNGGRFNWFLHQKELEIDAKNLKLFGHGVYADCCVRDALNEFTREIYKRHRITVDYKIMKKTSINSE